MSPATPKKSPKSVSTKSSCGARGFRRVHRRGFHRSRGRRGSKSRRGGVPDREHLHRQGYRPAHRAAARVRDDLGRGKIVSTDGNGSFKRPIYAGKAYRTVSPIEANYVLSIRANSFPPAPETPAPAPIEKVEAAVDAAKIRVQVKEVVVREAGKVDLTEADVVVFGGMGVKGPEGFTFLQPLCEVLGAAIGSSRAAVLAEFIHPSHQVGQTGKTVSPSLYVACGISGAIQHKAGMSTSKCIVAINTDPDAPIFEFADYGIVADLFKVVPPLIEEFKKVLD